MRSQVTKRIVALALVVVAFALVELVTIACLSTATHHLLVAALFEWDERIGWQSDRTERTLDVTSSPHIEVENFCGGVTVRAGQDGVVRLVVVKRAASRRLLDRVAVETSHHNGLTVVRAPQHPGVSVKLELTVPADTHLEVGTLVGNVDVRGQNLGPDVESSYAVGDEVGVLAAEVEDDDAAAQAGRAPSGRG